MTPRTIFTLILKIFGLYMVLELLTIVPQALSSFPLVGMSGPSISEAIMFILLIIVVLLIYIFLTRLLLFKTNWIIDKLSLDKHFGQEIIDVKVDSIAVIQLSIIVLGGVIFIDALPNLFKQIISFLQQKQQAENNLVKNPSFGYIIFYGCKLY